MASGHQEGGGGSYNERYVIFRGVVANMLQSVTGGWVGPEKGPKMRYVFYGRPLTCSDACISD